MNAETSEGPPRPVPPPVESGFADQASDVTKRMSRTLERMMASPEWPVFSALVLGFVALIESAIYSTTGDVGPFETAVLALLSTLPLAGRNRNLGVVAAVVTFATLLTILVPGVAWTLSGIFGQLWVCYLVAAKYPRRWTWLLGAIYLVQAVIPTGDMIGFGNVFMLVLVAATLALGDSRRLRGEALSERDESRRAMAETLRDQAAMEERARIARELHDVVAHHISAIAVQAEATRLTTPGMPEEGMQRLEQSALPLVLL